jgi:hypothetical protein
MTVEFVSFIKSQFPKKVQNILHLDERTQGLKIVSQASKMRWRSVSSFAIEAQNTTVYKYPHRQKSKGSMSGERWGFT